MSKKVSEASGKRSVTTTATRPWWRSALDRLGVGGVGDREQRRGVLAPAPRLAAGGQHLAPGGEDRGPPQVRRHLGQEGQRRLRAVACGGLGGSGVGHLGEDTDP
jgi:hypothetical protein